MAPKKIIIDTDPGVDDIMAILLALSSSAEELQVLLMSLTFGNVDLESCLRNIVSMFHVLELERQWRLENSLSPGFTTLESCHPIVALGANSPLENVVHQYDYFHGKDGLSGVHTTAPHFTPTEMWKHLFTAQYPPTAKSHSSTPVPSTESPFAALPPNFKPSARPSHLEILDLLRTHPPDTITLIAIGPLTNFALAAAAEPETFLRAHEIVVMGGTINEPGNVTPLAEFNTYACAYSAARVYALTSPMPQTVGGCELQGNERARVTVFPLDITTRHPLHAADAETVMGGLAERGSPLAQWMGVFMKATFGKMESVYSTETDIALHDPLTVWYVLTSEREGWVVEKGVDLRVETEGLWTRGMCVIDKRGKRRVEEAEAELLEHDIDGWLHPNHGNRLNVAKESPDRTGFGREMLERIFRC